MSKQIQTNPYLINIIMNLNHQLYHAFTSYALQTEYERDSHQTLHVISREARSAIMYFNTEWSYN